MAHNKKNVLQLARHPLTNFTANDLPWAVPHKTRGIDQVEVHTHAGAHAHAHARMYEDPHTHANT